MLPQAVEGRKIRLVSELFEHVGHMVENLKTTHLKFNIAPEKFPSQKESNLPTIIFQGRTVKLRVCNGWNPTKPRFGR